MRFALAMFAVVALLATSGAALAQDNSCTTVVLHAVAGFNTGCTTTLDCAAVPPLVNVASPSGPYTVFMFLNHYAEVNAVQVAFDWPPTWNFGFGLWSCQTGQLTAVTPTAPGPTDGTITTAFNTVTGGALIPVGLMVFNSIGTGCISIVESSYPFGNVVNDGSGDVTPIQDANEGKICVDTGGVDACECILGAVEPSTWGSIKGTYR